MTDIITDSNPVTLADFESLASDGAVRNLIHTIRDYNSFFDQGVVIEGNDGFGDKGKIITSYPEGQTRALNEGWDAERATGKDARYMACMIRTRSEVDVDLYESRKPAERDSWRLSKDMAFMRGLSRTAVKKVFFGNPQTNTNDPQGLYNIVTRSNDAFKNRMINGGGSTANKEASIWLINWDTDGMYMFFPQYGSQAGLRVKNMGEQYCFDASGKRFTGLITEFAWDIGMAAYDPEKIVRVCNVDSSKLSKSRTTSGSQDLVDLCQQALEMMPDDAQGRMAFYMNDSLRSALSRQITNTSNALLSIDEVAGRKVLTFRGVPVHKLGHDVLTNTEAVVSFS